MMRTQPTPPRLATPADAIATPAHGVATPAAVRVSRAAGIATPAHGVAATRSAGRGHARRRLALCVCLLSAACADPSTAPRARGDATALDAALTRDAAPVPLPDRALGDSTPGTDAAPSDGADAEAAPADGLRPDGTPDAGPLPPPELAPLTACTEPGPLDDTLRLNHLWLLGTHNSYHIEPAILAHPSHAYTHPALTEQLNLGVRQFELDLHLRVGRGFEVFHLPRIDEATTCRRFVDCLAELRTWSAAHPCHAPLVIWIEPKDEDLDRIDNTLELFADRHPELEAEILSVWPRDRLFTPDDLRGAHPTLPAALAAEGWPTLGQLRGKLVFAMLDSDNHRAAYLALSPGEAGAHLAGRLMFVAADGPTDAFAAMFKINNAAREAERVAAMVDAGFFVTSNIDGATEAAATPEGDRPGAPAWAHLEASLAAAPHSFSSDFVVPHPSTGYVATLPGGSPGCHPRLASPDCTAAAVEAAEGR